MDLTKLVPDTTKLAIEEMTNTRGYEILIAYLDGEVVKANNRLISTPFVDIKDVAINQEKIRMINQIKTQINRWLQT